MWDLIVSVPDHCLSFYFALRPRERGSFIMLTHIRQRFWTAAVSARRYGLSANTIHNRLRKK